MFEELINILQWIKIAVQSKLTAPRVLSARPFERPEGPKDAEVAVSVVIGQSNHFGFGQLKTALKLC